MCISMQAVTSEGDCHIQLLIANLLCDAIIPLLEGDENSLLTQCVIKFLEENLGGNSCAHKLCWRIVAAICSWNEPSKDILEWTKHYNTPLGRVFVRYCEQQRLTGDRCNITKDLPVPIQQSSEDMRKYIIIIISHIAGSLLV